jgi:hypothetical protein
VGPVHPLFTCARVGRAAARWHDAAVSDLDWSTPDGLAAIRDHLAAGSTAGASRSRTPWGSARVVVTGVGVRPRQRARAAARAARRRARHRARPRRSTGHRAALAPPARRAVESLAPAEACTERRPPEPRRVARGAAELDGNPAREAQAVFVADLDDPVTSEADGSMRATFEGHAPEL